MGLLRMIVGIMIILWLLGFVLSIGGGMIHTLLVIAVIIFVFDLIGGRRR
ncbi:lmo0937 family membrane protein [Clostridium estertheticum]|nr:lmo0937 family membrane protein [Clostridium estertheticum]MCB2308744.1 lmo0937 family membrane protein [Clostridium estertheticum]MCB2347690.1 lmo0937 family membrane protein [Clostridium estertheticum]MCB2351702.1 lmo0937 family membrane protein [Clostridium estertheticum]WAG46283.1 lmo0937 family membrane protein [Clostridium estertheticum]